MNFLSVLFVFVACSWKGSVMGVYGPTGQKSSAQGWLTKWTNNESHKGIYNIENLEWQSGGEKCPSQTPPLRKDGSGV
jgi:hypothetical protein